METTSRDLSRSQDATVGYPHVTDIIALVRPMNFTPESALERGGHVHRACALLDGWGDGSGLDLFSLHPVLVPYVDAYRAWLLIWCPKFIAIEATVIHHGYRYQGRLDRVTDEEIWDIKCGPDISPSEGLQTSAYMRAFSPKSRRRFSLHLYPNGKYKVEEWKDRADFPVFLGLLGTHQWRIRHGLVSESRDRSKG